MNEQECKARVRELYDELAARLDEMQEHFGVGEGATVSKQENDNRMNEQEVDGLKETTNTKHERVRKVPDLEGVRELLEKGRPLTEQETAYAVEQLNGATKMRQDLIVRLKEMREVVREANREVEKL